MEPSIYYAVRLLSNDSNFVLVPESWILCWLSPKTVNVRYPSVDHDVIMQTLKHGERVESNDWTVYHSASVVFKSRSLSKVDVWIQLSNNDGDEDIDAADTLNETKGKATEHKNQQDDHRIVLKISLKRSLPRDTNKNKLKEQRRIKKNRKSKEKTTNTETKWSTEIVRNVNTTINNAKDSLSHTKHVNEKYIVDNEIERQLSEIHSNNSSRSENNQIDLCKDSQDSLDILKYPVLKSSTSDINTEHSINENRTCVGNYKHSKLMKNTEPPNEEISVFKQYTNIHPENNNSNEYIILPSPAPSPDIVTIKIKPVEERKDIPFINTEHSINENRTCVGNYKHSKLMKNTEPPYEEISVFKQYTNIHPENNNSNEYIILPSPAPSPDIVTIKMEPVEERKDIPFINTERSINENRTCVGNYKHRTCVGNYKHSKLMENTEPPNEEASIFKQNASIHHGNNNSNEYEIIPSPTSSPGSVIIKMEPVEERKDIPVVNNNTDNYPQVSIKLEIPMNDQKISHDTNKTETERDTILKSLIASGNHFPKIESTLNKNFKTIFESSTTNNLKSLPIISENSNHFELKEVIQNENIYEETKCNGPSIPIFFNENDRNPVPEDKDQKILHYDNFKLDTKFNQLEGFSPIDRQCMKPTTDDSKEIKIKNILMESQVDNPLYQNIDKDLTKLKNTHDSSCIKPNDLPLSYKTHLSPSNITLTHVNRNIELQIKSKPSEGLHFQSHETGCSKVDQNDFVTPMANNTNISLQQNFFESKPSGQHILSQSRDTMHILLANKQDLPYQQSENNYQTDNMLTKNLKEDYPPFIYNQISKNLHITETSTGPNERSLMSLLKQPNELTKRRHNKHKSSNISLHYSGYPPNNSPLHTNTNNINETSSFRNDNNVTPPVLNSYVLPSKTRHGSSPLQNKRKNSDKTKYLSKSLKDTNLNINNNYTSIASLDSSPYQMNTFLSIDRRPNLSVPTNTTAAIRVNIASNVVSNKSIYKQSNQFPNIPNNNHNKNIPSNYYSYLPNQISNTKTADTCPNTTLPDFQNGKGNHVFPANQNKYSDDLTNFAPHITYPNTQNADSTSIYNVAKAPDNHPNVYLPYHHNKLPQVLNRKDDANILTAPPRQCCLPTNHTNNNPAIIHGSPHELATCPHNFLPYPPNQFPSQYLNDTKHYNQETYSVKSSFPPIRNDYVRDQNTNKLYLANYTKVNEPYQAMAYQNIETSSPMIELNVTLPHLPHGTLPHLPHGTLPNLPHRTLPHLPPFQYHPTQNNDIYGKNIINTDHSKQTAVFQPQVCREVPNNHLISQMQNDYHNKNIGTFSNANYINNSPNFAVNTNNGLNVTKNSRGFVNNVGNNTANVTTSSNDHLQRYYNSLLDELSLVKRLL